LLLVLLLVVAKIFFSKVSMRRGEAYTGFGCGNLRERDHLGDPGVDGRIILRWLFRKWDVGAWPGSG